MVEYGSKHIAMYGCRSKHKTWQLSIKHGKSAQTHRFEQSITNDIIQACEHVTLTST